MSTLREDVTDYLATRRAMGFKVEGLSKLLASFVTFCEARGAVRVQDDLAIQWATTPIKVPVTDALIARRMDAGRVFARHQHALDPATQIPAEGIGNRRYQPREPNVFTQAQVLALLAAADTLSPRFKAITWRTLIGLLAATGMRPGEACRLSVDDVDLAGGVLQVLDTKFGKSRLVFIHPSTATVLADYLQVRRDWVGTTARACPAVFVNSRREPINPHRLGATFRQVVAAAVAANPGHRPPRLHDLRHTFTVATILGWYRDGYDVQARLPLLSIGSVTSIPPRPTGTCTPSPNCSPTPPPASSLQQARRPGRGRHDRADPAGTAPRVLHRATGPAAAGQPADDQRLPGHDQAPAAVRRANDEQGPVRLTIDDLDAVTVGAFLDHLDTERHNSTTTRNARLAAIHSLHRYALPLIPDRAHTASQVLAIPPRRHARATVSYLTGPETDALLAAPDRTTWHGRRDHALLLTAAQTGLRLSELTGLSIQDITTTPSGGAVRTTGKGRRERATPLTRQTAAVLLAWLPETGPAPSSPTFPTRRGTRMSADAVQRLVAKHAATAALECPSIASKHVSPHTLRHTAAMALMTAGVDTSVIALWLGHQNAATTHLYLHADMSIKERALARVPTPGTRPGRYRPADDLIDFLETL